MEWEKKKNQALLWGLFVCLLLLPTTKTGWLLEGIVFGKVWLEWVQGRVEEKDWHQLADDYFKEFCVTSWKEMHQQWEAGQSEENLLTQKRGGWLKRCPWICEKAQNWVHTGRLRLSWEHGLSSHSERRKNEYVGTDAHELVDVMVREDGSSFWLLLCSRWDPKQQREVVLKEGLRRSVKESRGTGE